VVEKLLKKSAKEALDVANIAGEILDPKVREVLELTAGVKIKRRYRKATTKDIELLSKIRKNIDAGWNKNVAYTKGKIGDEIIDLQSRSGKQTGTSKDYDSFKIIEPENYNYKNGPLNRLHDSEQKQIEYLYNKFKNNKNVQGQIEIVSDLKICDNCEDIIDKFQKNFPNIEIVRVWVRKELKR
ncbi:deaminase domain-containing protein, partial [Lacinutrix salivirga]